MPLSRKQSAGGTDERNPLCPNALDGTAGLSRARRGRGRAVPCKVLRPFQTEFVKNAFSGRYDTVCLSIPRGNGKSFLASWILERCLTPGHRWNEPGKEYCLLASTLDQSRHVFRPLRQALEPTGEYRFIDSVTRVGILHKASQTRLRVMSSSGKAAMGLVNTPLVVFDEPGALTSVKNAELLHAAIQGAMGKPGSPLRAIYIGTLAPESPGGWWHRMVERGTHGSTYVQALQGDKDKWDLWPEIRRCNPLCNISPSFRKKLLEERDAARLDGRLKANFLSYRINLPSADTSTVLLRVEDFERMAARETPPRAGRPVVGIDLGGGRSWSGGVGIWPNGRVEALAVAPGIPSIEQQERRDRVPRGTYESLLADGALSVADGLRVQPPALLMDHVVRTWGRPAVIVCDRFRLNELRDCARGIPLDSRISRWSESSEDIRALRRRAMDGPLAVAESSRSLMAASLSAAMVRNDSSGNVRLLKRGTNNQARDDVAAALVFAAGLWDRSRPPPRRRRWAMAAPG